MPSEVDRDYGTGPRGNVNSRSTLCPIEKKDKLAKDVPFSSHLTAFVL